ncbi:MAG: hypothetical protein WC846_00210 [Candidatus Gracilibacteria bacterium]|jgi:hypothetical protein
MDNQPISISEALNHIQSWLNAGDYNKVIQGASEVLQMEPGNQRALALMKLAEEKRHGTPLVDNAAVDPLKNLQVENIHADMPNSPRKEESPAVEKGKLFLAMLIPALAIVLIGGGALYYLSTQNREEIIHAAITNLPSDTSYLDENENRINEMTKMSSVIEEYRAKNGVYPAANQIENVLVQSDQFEKVPVDPQSGQVDKNNKRFDYIYAVYDSIAGENTVYILSALFEDSKGFGYPWTVGENTKNYANYRASKESNIKVIGGKDD